MTRTHPSGAWRPVASSAAPLAAALGAALLLAGCASSGGGSPAASPTGGGSPSAARPTTTSSAPASASPRPSTPDPSNPQAVAAYLVSATRVWRTTPVQIDLTEAMTTGGDSTPVMSMSGFADPAGTAEFTVTSADLSSDSPGPGRQVTVREVGGVVYASIADQPGKWRETTAPLDGVGQVVSEQVITSVTWHAQGRQDVAGQTLTAYAGTAPFSQLAAAVPQANLSALPAQVRSSPATLTVGVDADGRVTAEEFSLSLAAVPDAPSDLVLTGSTTLSAPATVPPVTAPDPADVIQRVTTPVI